MEPERKPEENMSTLDAARLGLQVCATEQLRLALVIACEKFVVSYVKHVKPLPADITAEDRQHIMDSMCALTIVNALNEAAMRHMKEDEDGDKAAEIAQAAIARAAAVPGNGTKH
jgi:hypothetical protein